MILNLKIDNIRAAGSSIGVIRDEKCPVEKE